MILSVVGRDLNFSVMVVRAHLYLVRHNVMFSLSINWIYIWKACCCCVYTIFLLSLSLIILCYCYYHADDDDNLTRQVRGMCLPLPIIFIFSQKLTYYHNKRHIHGWIDGHSKKILITPFTLFLLCIHISKIYEVKPIQKKRMLVFHV